MTHFINSSKNGIPSTQVAVNLMMWQKLLSNIGKHCKLNPPLSEHAIANTLNTFGAPLNDSLKSFLLETDGLYDPKPYLWLVWNVRDLAAYNNEMRTNNPYATSGKTFEDIFFISNAGVDGILFGFPIVDGSMQEKVVAFYPTEGERVDRAENLEEYLRGCLQD